MKGFMCYYETASSGNVEHDVAKLGVWPTPTPTPTAAAAATTVDGGGAPPSTKKPSRGPFEATFDYIFYGAARLCCEAVRTPLTAEQLTRVVEEGDCFPNAWHMSDHLPVAASFRFR